MGNQQDADSKARAKAAEHGVLRFVQSLHKRVAAKYTLQPIVLSTMWVKLLSVVADFCFSPFLVTDQETASDAPEKSSPSSQDPQQPASTGKSTHEDLKKKNHASLKRVTFPILISKIFF